VRMVGRAKTKESAASGRFPLSTALFSVCLCGVFLCGVYLCNVILYTLSLGRLHGPTLRSGMLRPSLHVRLERECPGAL
jgi:hypothetical protein